LPLEIVLRAGSALEATAELFVSYTNGDRAWAESIAWQLEADGYQVIVQVLDFTLVVSGPKGLQAANIHVVVASKAKELRRGRTAAFSFVRPVEASRKS
jgi:hypothetical protein